MGSPEIVAFLSWLATARDVSASTQNQALHAVLFLYRAVLGRELQELQGVARARVPHRLPVVLARPLRDHLRAVKTVHGAEWFPVVPLLLCCRADYVNSHVGQAFRPARTRGSAGLKPCPT